MQHIVFRGGQEPKKGREWSPFMCMKPADEAEKKKESDAVGILCIVVVFFIPAFLVFVFIHLFLAHGASSGSVEICTLKANHTVAVKCRNHVAPVIDCFPCGLFHDTLGITFQDYLKEKRFEHAFALIENTERTILEISLESGFSDERYLIAVFRDRMGCSPRDYRKSIRQTKTERAKSSASNQRILDAQEVLQILERRGLQDHE